MSGRNGAQAIYDSARLSDEIAAYQKWLDEKAEEEYLLASEAKSKGLDFSRDIEIPRAADLASRTEKLLEEYLKGLKIEDDLRELLGSTDRESASIQIAVDVARKMHVRDGDLRDAIDCGLRVGLAVLTEAVLVAPLDGIGAVRILNNVDGSEFLSIDFCGPIRAAGGTAQALCVLIGDMIRRELGIGRYVPSTPEVERVKEEFGLYRVGLQYKPPPEEVETIVRACPVMVNGEETERQECAGYKEIRNVQNENGSFRTRVRGGVLLVIGEGLCLKAPKIVKHTERMRIPGWDFISQFAEKGKPQEDKTGDFKSRAIPKISRYMDDVIAGRPIFGEPGEPGGFRLRYGRSRATGLAAAGMNPISMEAAGGFISVGTQMKIERPGKACAVTPCVDVDGPTVLLSDGEYRMISSLAEWDSVKDEVVSIWDNGEILMGLGEFLENNKDLVPSAYNRDWWAADLVDSIDHPEKVLRLAEILDCERGKLPPGVPFNGAINRGGESDLERSWRRRDWYVFLRDLELTWEQCRGICGDFGTAVPPPWNLWWADLPISFAPPLIDSLIHSEVGSEGLRIRGAAEGWGPDGSVGDLDIEEEGHEKWPRWTSVRMHGVTKSSLMTLGLQHIHDGGDILIPKNWESLLDGLGLEQRDGGIVPVVESGPHISSRIQRIKESNAVIREEEERLADLEARRAVARVEATTAAMQSGKGTLETEAIGDEAAEKIEDQGPRDSAALRNSRVLLDGHEVERCLWLVRNLSQMRWENSVPCRIGARMGRPEKSGVREMKPLVHALYPIAENGGPQRLLGHASSKGNLRVQLGPRICEDCGRESPHIRCHNRPDPHVAVECGGRTIERRGRGAKRRRKGELTNVPLSSILEVKRRALGMDRLPGKVKAVKGLISVGQTPEPLEKGLLRAKHGVSVFRDGTARYDMSDVPITHFKPSEIGTPWKVLYELGYTHDMYGETLSSDDQILELLPQDFVPSTRSIDHLLSTCNFVDDLLVRFYGMEPFYNATTEADLVGQLAIGLAPHTSGGVLCRIVGWTSSSAGYAHPLFHAAKRRNCDGDEDSIMLLLDGLLNFSKEILPAGRGGRMDAPLVLTTRLNPKEIDKEALNVDCSWGYPRSFYEATLSQPHPNEASSLVDLVSDRLGSIGDIRGYGWTHDSGNLDAGPVNSAYKTLETMNDKMTEQLALGSRLRSVSVRRVASQVIESHFLPDMRGNLMAFTRQKVRCVKCGHSYRRMPLAGKCVQRVAGSVGFSGTEDGESSCKGNVVLTVSEGAVRKYIKVTKEVMESYGVDDYTKQRVEWMSESVDSLFSNDSVTVMTLEDFI
ncbi:MAG: hypothetical protein VX865_02350 [Candidatus Thermoplasmatota archaeon]|nr:hypothetical protein [Candidatus Thermoplasmatota archaeon]MED5273804.1 hypothetical protein [Candidatus Thermoplasmatota archaeon]